MSPFFERFFGKQKSAEKEPLKEKGQDTEVKITFVRHAQKADPKVFEKNLQGVSRASISEKGAEKARVVGKEFKDKGRVITKGFRTPVDRTLETLQEIFKEAPVRHEAIKKAEYIGKYLGFPMINFSPETTKKYNAIMEEAKKKYLAEKFSGRKYEELNLDEQTEVAETAEEPALQWYLDHNKNRPDKDTYSPYEAGSAVAYKLNRFINATDRMPHGKSLDILTAGHKTSTEAFLKYCLVQNTQNGKKTGFNKLEEIGGSMGLLDNWELKINNDKVGKKTIKLSFRGKEYEVDLGQLREMAKVGMKLFGKEETKIDKPGK